ncbi:MAG TPA: hypothetical protein VHT05_03375 [Candidatus Elarobacter sp.]|nr:hypothetical protein [Candidatus Elarobacter sp.]
MNSLLRHFKTLAAAIVLLAPALVPLQAPASPVMVLPDCTGKLQVRPSQVIFACGDGNFFAHGLHWANWGASTTSATGTGQFTVCTPNCAQGKPHSAPIKVIASGRQSCAGGRPAYASVTFAWLSPVSGRPPFSMRFTCK